MKKTIFLFSFCIICLCINIFSQTTSKNIAYIDNKNILNKKDKEESYNYKAPVSIKDDKKEKINHSEPKHIFAISFVYLNKKLRIGEDDFSFAMEPNTLSPTFQGGITFTNAYNNGLGFQIGLLLESTHDSYKIHSERFYDVGLFDTYQSSKINQFSLYFPIRIQYRFNFNDYIASYIYIGLGFNIGLRADLDFHDEIYLENETKIIDFSQNLYGNYWNYSNILFELGMGIDIKRIQIGVSQAYGMTNVMKKEGRIQEPLALNVGFLF